jgi:hypothetical protein
MNQTTLEKCCQRISNNYKERLIFNDYFQKIAVLHQMGGILPDNYYPFLTCEGSDLLVVFRESSEPAPLSNCRNKTKNSSFFT